jgi:hypothetical protein
MNLDDPTSASRAQRAQDFERAAARRCIEQSIRHVHKVIASGQRERAVEELRLALVLKRDRKPDSIAIALARELIQRASGGGSMLKGQSSSNVG